MCCCQLRGVRVLRIAAFCGLFAVVASCGKRDSVTALPPNPSPTRQSQIPPSDASAQNEVVATAPPNVPADVASELPPTIQLPDLPGDSDAVVVFPNGKQAVTCGENGHLTLYDVATSKATAELEGLPGVPRLAVSGDGTLLAQTSSTETRIRIWSVEKLEELQTIDGHAQPISDIAFSPDGSRLATASSSSDATAGGIQIWDLRNAGTPQTLAADRGVNSIAFSRDGQHLASCGDSSSDGVDSETNLWNLATGDRTKTWENKLGSTFQVAFSPDGKTLAIAEWNGLHRIHSSNRIRLVDLDTGKERAALLGHILEIGAIAFSPDGNFLASVGADGLLVLWQVPTASLRASARLSGYAGGKLSWADEGNRFALAAKLDTESVCPMLWSVDFVTGQPPSIFGVGGPAGMRSMHAQMIISLTYSQDGRRLGYGTRSKGTIVLDSETLAPIQLAESAASLPQAFAPDLSVSVVLNDKLELRELGGKGRIRELADQAQVLADLGYTEKVPQPVLFAARVSRDGRFLLTTHTDSPVSLSSIPGFIKVRNWPSLETYAVSNFPEGFAYACDFSKDARTLVVAGGAFGGSLPGTEGPISIYDMTAVLQPEPWKLRSLKRPVKWKMSPAVQTAFELASEELLINHELGRAEQAIRQVAGELPEISLSTDPKDIHWHLVDSNPTQFGAVRFHIAKEEAVDLVWHFGCPGQFMVGYGILPPAGTPAHQPKYLATSIMSVGNVGYFQHVSRVITRDELIPEKDYIIWWASNQGITIPFQVAVNTIPAGTPESDGWAWPVQEEMLKDKPLLRRNRLMFHGDAVVAVSMSPDGKRLVSVGGEGGAKVWDVQTGAVLASFSSTHAQYSPDGRFLATVDQDGGSTAVTLWNAETNERVRQLSGGHFGRIHQLVFSPDGSRLATGGDDGMITIWDTETGLPAWPTSAEESR